jgi:phosphohistidine phosphatase SixA
MRMVVEKFARARYLLLAAAYVAAATGPAQAQMADPESIAERLRSGGYVLVMRHASSPREAPGPRMADTRNRNRERQLDETGQAHAIAVGYAFRQLGIDIGEVMSSPAFRAWQTALYMGYDGRTQHAEELGTEARDADWLREIAGSAPEGGTNRLLITHAPNVQEAFGDAAASMSDGETLVVDPNGGDPQVIGRLTPEDWSVLAVQSERS